MSDIMAPPPVKEGGPSGPAPPPRRHVGWIVAAIVAAGCVIGGGIGGAIAATSNGTAQEPAVSSTLEDTTTQAPDTSTQAPDTSTQAPDTTTAATPTERLAADGYTYNVSTYTAEEFAAVSGDDSVAQFVSGAAIGYDDAGNGEVVLRLTEAGHSVLSTSAGWDAFMQAMQDSMQDSDVSLTVELDGYWVIIHGGL